MHSPTPHLGPGISLLLPTFTFTLTPPLLQAWVCLRKMMIDMVLATDMKQVRSAMPMNNKDFSVPYLALLGTSSSLLGPPSAPCIPHWCSSYLPLMPLLLHLLQHAIHLAIPRPHALTIPTCYLTLLATSSMPILF